MKTGFVGLGALDLGRGMGMARNLNKHALLSAVWNRSAAKAQSFAAECGCSAPPSLMALA